MNENVAVAQAIEHAEADREQRERMADIVAQKLGIVFSAKTIYPFHRLDCWIGQAAARAENRGGVNSVFQERESIAKIRPYINCPECLELFAKEEGA